MSSVEKVGNILSDRKEEVATTPFLEKKSLTRDVDKGTGELEYMKEVVLKIRRKDLYKFEGQSKGSTGWFKLDSGFKKTKISSIYPELYKRLLKKDIEYQDTEPYKTFIFSFDKESSKKKYVKLDQTRLLNQNQQHQKK